MLSSNVRLINYCYRSGKCYKLKIVYKVTSPTLTVYSSDTSDANGTAVIICAGGGFDFFAINSEGNDVANWLAKKGINSFVLRYRVTLTFTNDPMREFMEKVGNPEFEQQAKLIVPLAVCICIQRWTRLRYALTASFDR